MTYPCRLCLLLAGVSLTACTAPLQGPEADLHAIATPDPVPQVVRPVPQPAPGPPPAQGHFRAWVPRQVQPNGDTVEGHWIMRAGRCWGKPWKAGRMACAIHLSP